MSGIRNYTALIIAALVGLALFVWLNWFPPGGGDMDSPLGETERTTRAAAEQTALAFVERHFGSGDWRVFAFYDANAAATGYLNKEKPEADPLEVWPVAPVEYFRVEAEEPLGDTRLTVFVSAEEPRVIGWETEKATWSSEWIQYDSPEAALRALGFDPGHFAAEENGGTEVTYTHRVPVGELRFRLDFSLSEGRVLSVVPVVEAPQSLVKLLGDYEAKGLVITLSTLLGSFLLGIAAIVLASLHRKDIAFGRGIWLTLAYFVPLAVYSAGLYPAFRAGMPFMPAGAAFAVMFQQGFNMVNAVIVWLSLVAGEGLWRKMGFRLWPDLRESSFAPDVKRSVWLGYLFCFIILGVQAVVLYTGYVRFGVWTTADPLTDGRNQLFLTLYPLLAWTAAISEEAIYRLFAIACFTMMFRPLWRWMHRLTGKPVFLNPLLAIVPAAVLASILWGAAHAGYAVYPVYTRLIEVSLLGLVFSWLFLRYGLMAAIFAHAAVDLLWMGLDMMFNDSRYALLGLFYMITPVLAGYAAAQLASFLQSRRADAGSPLEP